MSGDSIGEFSAMTAERILFGRNLACISLIIYVVSGSMPAEATTISFAVPQ